MEVGESNLTATNDKELKLYALYTLQAKKVKKCNMMSSRSTDGRFANMNFITGNLSENKLHPYPQTPIRNQIHMTFTFFSR